MPRTELEYPKLPFGTVKRYSPRASYTLRTIHQIVNSCPILHVSFNSSESPFPVILPLIGTMGSFERPSADEGDVLDLYLHGYVSSRIINASRNAPGTQENGEAAPKGLPVSIAASHVDGLVLALTPNSHSYNYRSVVLFGYATVVEETAEKLYAMELITNSVVPDRWNNSRVPPNKAEMSSTSVLKVSIVTGSAKIRAGPPSDEKHDKDSPEVVDSTWTGVVPVYYTLGAPVPGPYNAVSEVPSHITDYVKDNNEYNIDLALEATKTSQTQKGK